MTVYKVYLEGNSSGCMAHILSLPGCFTCGKTEAMALRNLTQAVKIHLIWLRKNKLINTVPQGIVFQIAERQTGNPPWLSGSTAALFLPDLIPPTSAEINNYIRLLRFSRSELLRLVTRLPEEILDYKIKKRWTIRRNLDHIAMAEWWYLSRIKDWKELESIPQRVPPGKIIERMQKTRNLAYRILHRLADSKYHQVFIPTKYCNRRLKETWTARKVLRRFIEHEREHYLNIKDILAQISKHSKH